jgi:hypothetical protein
MKTLALSPSPNASTNPVGTWRGAVVADWDERRGLPTEDDRVAVPNGTMVDRSERESVSVEAWMPQPALRSGGPTRGRRRGSPEITFTPRTIKLIPLEGSCRIHGPDPLIQVVATNAAPPYVWTEGGVDTITDQNTYRAHYAFPDGHFQVSCRWRDSHSSLFVSDSVRCDPINCRPGRTNFVGACWYSTHNPTNAADHAPGISEEDVVFGPLCPVAHDVNVKLGWTHNTAILWIRNLVRIVTGDPKDDETDHCIAYDWRKNGTVDLNSFLASEILPYTNRVEYYVDERPSSGILSHGSEPARYHPHIHHVELRSRASGATFDRLWIVINRRETRINYEKWLSENTNDVSWATRLPKPYASISLSTNENGVISAIDPEPGAPDLWTAPDSTDGSYLHHDAKWEMRAYANEEGHGNQACYDEHGILITNGISGGTADYVPGFWYHVGGHVPKDVYPFLNAVHLDGNPGDSTFMNDVTRPCIRQGTNMDLYIRCRPISLPEEQR